MGKLVVLELNGDWQNGFQAALEIRKEGEQQILKKVRGALPANPQLEQHVHEHWQNQYRSLGHPSRRKSWRITAKSILKGDLEERIAQCRSSAQKLREKLRNWLNSTEFSLLDRRLREELNRQEEIRFLISTDYRDLYKLPWQEWDFFTSYPRAEVGFSATEFESSTPNNSSGQKVRILAILGHSEAINVELDRQRLEALPHAEVVFLVEPSRQELSVQLWEQSWDILFFAGHSETEGERGVIYLNPQDNLSLDELRNGLTKAIARGLQLAIFNSCDGLGLAKELEQLQIPQMIVMREPVPDQVAQEFLKNFLPAFSGGKSLFLAQREAREKLEAWEGEYPCASWLPVIFQNPTTTPPDWQDFGQKNRISGHRNSISFWQVLIASTLTTGLIIGLRSLGLLQGYELKTLDLLMRLRPFEPRDERLLVIRVDESDIQYQDQMGMERRGSLSDQALSQLLSKLKPHQPAVIGLDIYHDFDFPTQLGQKLQADEHFIGLCKVGALKEGISSPPGIAETNLGFSDIPSDPDSVIRRQLLGMSSSTSCSTPFSFSLQVALHYLMQQESTGIDHNNPVVFTKTNQAKIGDLIIPQLPHNAGGYQLPSEEARGYQILVNYRASDPQQINLQDVLNSSDDNQLADLIKGRIILIGVGKDSKDRHKTPYNQHLWGEYTAGVVVQAQMASQIINAVLGKRPLLWWFPQWLEVIWIGGWSLIGSAVIWFVKYPKHEGITLFITVVSLGGVCFIVLLQGGWLPLIPPILGLIISSSCLFAYKQFSLKQSN